MKEGKEIRLEIAYGTSWGGWALVERNSGLFVESFFCSN